MKLKLAGNLKILLEDQDANMYNTAYRTKIKKRNKDKNQNMTKNRVKNKMASNERIRTISKSRRPNNRTNTEVGEPMSPRKAIEGHNQKLPYRA